MFTLKEILILVAASIIGASVFIIFHDCRIPAWMLVFAAFGLGCVLAAALSEKT